MCYCGVFWGGGVTYRGIKPIIHACFKINASCSPAPEDGHEGVEERAVRGRDVRVEERVVHRPHCMCVCVCVCELV